MIAHDPKRLRTAARRIVACGALAAFAAAACAAPAFAAGTSNPFAMFAALPTVGDAQLGTMRGRYVVPHSGGPGAVAAATALQPGPGIAGATDGVSAASVARSTHMAGPSISGLGTSVVYFGVQMTSTWQAPSGGVAVGLNLGINVQTDSVTISTWSSSNNGGLPAGPATGNSVNGAPPVSGISNGVGQSIQVAGDGNTVVNDAGLVVTQSAPDSVITPTTTTCGSTCTTTIGANSVTIAIATAQGTVSQSIGPDGVLQTVQLNGNSNQIESDLNMQAQVAPSTASGIGNILPILQSLNGLP
ncbi:MAG: hypothetical protein ACYCX6_12750 [Vulcanimicrobiaceae bacterium]